MKKLSFEEKVDLIFHMLRLSLSGKIISIDNHHMRKAGRDSVMESIITLEKANLIQTGKGDDVLIVFL